MQNSKLDFEFLDTTQSLCGTIYENVVQPYIGEWSIETFAEQFLRHVNESGKTEGELYVHLSMYDNAVNTIDTISYKHSTEYAFYESAFELTFKKFSALTIVLTCDGSNKEEYKYDDRMIYVGSDYASDHITDLTIM
jgi:hypothetical protein